MMRFQYITKTIIYFSKQTTVNSGLISAAAEMLSNSGLFMIVNDIIQLPTRSEAKLLVIDGSAEQVAQQELQQAGITANFHLIVSELGLNITEDVLITPEDLQLLTDAIEAACTTPDCSPKFNCPCSC